ncbi:MAG: glycoside hydrolase family 57 protein [Thermodesulfobacteriota bacterium]
MGERLNIAFIWHMHQPLYRHPFTGEYLLPWVLLHGTKDYYDMVSILEEFPDIHQTFNLVPSLIEQIEEYGSGEARDKYRSLTLKPASELTGEDKKFLLFHFFQANRDNMIRPLPGYWELLSKRGFSGEPDEVGEAARFFTEEEFRDLQLLFNLAWIDPWIREADPLLMRLVEKERGYTEEDKRSLLSKQIEIINRIIPKYAEMSEKGVVELTTSPYYHPIMPLLCDSFSAREAVPDIALPKERFSNPADAAAQLRRGIELHTRTFGRRPTGIWPPEGSVSMGMLPLLEEERIGWFATDEDILARSLGRQILRDSDGAAKEMFLYRPYSVRTGGEGTPITVLFRDRVLSDLIGFEYSRWEPEAAAADFIKRLTGIYDSLEKPGEHIVSIILDGENAWESYRNDGRDFLRAMYSALTGHPALRCVRVDEFLSETESREELPGLFSGSWINHNFRVWIGHPEDNTAWDYIAGAREALVKASGSAGSDPGALKMVEAARDELHAAEGSDWFWWYGDEHASMSDGEFDALFRAHLTKLYDLIKVEPPTYLDVPIISAERGFRPARLPTAFIEPVFDGEVTNYYEWLAAGRLERTYVSGAMHRGPAPAVEGDRKAGLIHCVSYGFNLETLFFRFDYLKELTPYEREWSFTINFLHPNLLRLNVRVEGKEARGTLYTRGTEEDDTWSELGALDLLAAGDVVELGIPFKDLGAAPEGGEGGGELKLFINVEGGVGGEGGLERWPAKGFLVVDVPTEEFERYNWMV